MPVGYRDARLAVLGGVQAARLGARVGCDAIPRNDQSVPQGPAQPGEATQGRGRSRGQAGLLGGLDELTDMGLGCLSDK